MLKSMTGYGRCEYQDSNIRMTVELKSVNHRYCEVFIRMPRQLGCFEDRIRSLITGRISRGKIDVFLNWDNIGEQAKEVVLDEGLAKAYYDAVVKISAKLGLRDDIYSSTLAKFPDILKVERKDEDDEAVWTVLRAAVNDAIDRLIVMRKKEGEKLQKSLSDILCIIESHVSFLETREPVVVHEYRDKLSARIQELMENNIVDETRIAMEVAIFADRCGINEELVRLKSHISQFRDIMKMDGPVGKKMDFLLQEMNREVNTIGSKANDLEITKYVVELKSEIEKVREQIQNIE
jgi:uncharacterized protein (TIGR00255 family)